MQRNAERYKRMGLFNLKGSCKGKQLLFKKPSNQGWDANTSSPSQDYRMASTSSAASIIMCSRWIDRNMSPSSYLLSTAVSVHPYLRRPFLPVYPSPALPPAYLGDLGCYRHGQQQFSGLAKLHQISLVLVSHLCCKHQRAELGPER